MTNAYKNLLKGSGSILKTVGEEEGEGGGMTFVRDKLIWEGGGN